MKALAEGGINTLRIPVGYWILGNIEDGEPWVTGQMKYLSRLLGWAQSLGLVAIIDLHCGPGSQNGFDNSGVKGNVLWDDPTQVNGEWRFLNVERTLTVLGGFADVFAVSNGEFSQVVIGIGILNEPRWSINLDFIQEQFYTPAYDVIRQNGAIDMHMSDAFRFGSVWKDFMSYPDYERVYLDTHIYHVFDNYLLSLSMEGHISHTCYSNKWQILNAPLWTVVGEWSLATTDCAKYLNGFNDPSLSRWQGEVNGSPRYGSCQGRNDSSTFSNEYRAQLKKFAEYQMDAYEGSRGWFFWTAKTEEAPQWDYLQGLSEGYIPKIQSRTLSCWS